MPGATFELTDSCFINNDFVGPGAVILSNPEDLLDHSGNYGTHDTGLECQGIAIGDTECIEYDSPVCVANPTLSAEAAPTSPSAPTPATTPVNPPTGGNTPTTPTPLTGPTAQQQTPTSGVAASFHVWMVLCTSSTSALLFLLL